MKRFGLVLVIIIAIFAGCQGISDEIIELGNYDTTTESIELSEIYQYYDSQFIITIEQAIADYQFMWDMVEENLPSIYLLERVLEIDVSEIRAEGLDHLMSHEYEFISIREFYNFLEQHHRIFRFIFHFSVIDGGLASFLLYPDNLEYFFDEVIFDLGWTISVYNHLFPWIEEMTIDEGNFYQHERPTFNVINDDLAIIEIPTFGMYSRESEELHYLLHSFYEYATNAGIGNIIFDVTRNGGGNTNFWIDHIIAPNIREELYADILILARNSETVVRFIDFWTHGELVMSEINDRQFDVINQDDLSEVELYSFVRRTIQPNHDGTPAFEGDFFILIDEFGFSATDGFANFAYQTGFATLVGTATRGAGIGMQRLIFSLPTSGLLVGFDVFYGVNPDGSANQEIGTSPHYFLEFYGPIRTVLSIIEERQTSEQE